MKSKHSLTHVDAAGHPAMVDVSDKAVTAREAVAYCAVRFPSAVAAQLRADGLRSKKGAVIDTAIIAGTLAVKRTSELIPFCHPLPIDGCRLRIDWQSANVLAIECAVKTRHRTGVEMEALTGATVAALTVYDMCKALSHAIVLGPARLLGKRGGKRDFGASDVDVGLDPERSRVSDVDAGRPVAAKQVAAEQVAAKPAPRSSATARTGGSVGIDGKRSVKAAVETAGNRGAGKRRADKPVANKSGTSTLRAGKSAANKSAANKSDARKPTATKRASTSRAGRGGGTRS